MAKLNDFSMKGAFEDIFPEKNSESYVFHIRYTDQFKDYNANIKMLGNNIYFNLSKKWGYVSSEIQIGLLQELLLKLFRQKKKTLNVDLYNGFIKNLYLVADKERPSQELESSFNRVNEKYFMGMMDVPNIRWGSNSQRKLGCYEYQSDTITISSALKDRDEDMVDYVMYHELLHKKLKYNNKNGRNYHHTGKFRKLENQFENAEQIERKLKTLGRRKSIFSLFD